MYNVAESYSTLKPMLKNFNLVKVVVGMGEGSVASNHKVITVLWIWMGMYSTVCFP